MCEIYSRIIYLLDVCYLHIFINIHLLRYDMGSIDKYFKPTKSKIILTIIFAVILFVLFRPLETGVIQCSRCGGYAGFGLIQWKMDGSEFSNFHENYNSLLIITIFLDLVISYQLACFTAFISSKLKIIK